MSPELIAALLGACVGFVGSGVILWILQQSNFRRADLERVRTRLGIAKGLRVDLAEAGALIDGAIKRAELVHSARFPVALWESHGNVLIAELPEDAEMALMGAFSRLRMSNTILDGFPKPVLSLAEDGDLTVEDIKALKGRVATAMSHLNQLIEGYERRLNVNERT